MPWVSGNLQLLPAPYNSVFICTLYLGIKVMAGIGSASLLKTSKVDSVAVGSVKFCKVVSVSENDVQSGASGLTKVVLA